MIQATVIILSGVLFAAGGYHWLICRRYFMLLVIAIGCFLITHSWWSFTVLAGIPFLCLGYGDNSPFRHIFNQGWCRSVWGLLVALILSLGLLLTGFMPWYWFTVYLVLGFTLDNALKSLYQIAGDFIVGASLGCIILMVR